MNKAAKKAFNEQVDVILEHGFKLKGYSEVDQITSKIFTMTKKLFRSTQEVGFLCFQRSFEKLWLNYQTKEFLF